MERVLNQQEIDAMVSAARGDKAAAGSNSADVRPCTFRQSGQLTGAQVRTVSGLHENFARALTQSLGAYLRVPCAAALVSVEQLPYCEFLERVPELTYLVSFNVPQVSASAGLQMDHSLIFPLIDILLGGTGNCEALPREVSEIEEGIVEGVASLICRELDLTWAEVALSVEVEQRKSPSQIQHFLSPSEKTLCLSLEVKLAERHGNLNLVLPASVSSVLLRKLTIESSHGKPKPNLRAGKRLWEKMLDCNFATSLGLKDLDIPIRDLLTLKPGDVIDLRAPLRRSAALLIAERSCFQALPVRTGRHRAAQIGEAATTRDERPFHERTN